MTQKKPIRILFDAHPLIGNNKSGVGYYTQGLIEALAKAYPDEIILTGYYFNFLGRKNIKLSVDAPNVRFKAIHYFPGIIISPLSRILGIQLPIELFIFRKFDLQLFTNFVSFPTLRRTPQFITIHDLGYMDHPEYVQAKNLKYMRKLVHICAKRASVILVVSEFTKKRVQSLLKLDTKTVVTPIPYIPARNSADPILSDRLLDLGIKKGSYLLYLGTIEPRKNITGLIAAYEMLPQNVRDSYSLVLAGGKGWHDEEIIAAIEAAKSRGIPIIQTGYVSDTERIALYANARAFGLASHYEGFGMPVLEAMSLGAPAAVSDIEIFHEVAGDSVLYFNSADPADIKDKIEKVLLDETIRTNLTNKAFARAQSFNWSNVARIAYDAFAEVASRQR